MEKYNECDGEYEVEYETEDLEDDDGEREHPFSTKNIKITSSPVTIDNIVKRLKHNEIDLHPDFQRRGDLWTRKKMSRLIESILLRLPLPMFYFDVGDPDKWIVIDGLQRLSSIKRFIVDEDLRLGHLEFLTDLKGKKFSELDRPYKRVIEETQIMTYQVEAQTPKEVKYSLFNRINTGGLILSPQEIRQALNQKNLGVNILESMINTDSFKRVVNILSKRKVANELALRFIGFSKIYDNLEDKFKHYLPDFLDRTMEEVDQFKDNLYIEKFTKQLDETLLYIERVIDKEIVFNKTLAKPKNKKNVNRSLFDLWTTTIFNLNETEKVVLENKKQLLRDKYKALLLNPVFDDAITQGTNSKKSVIKRFELFKQMIGEVINETK